MSEKKTELLETIATTREKVLEIRGNLRNLAIDLAGWEFARLAVEAAAGGCTCVIVTLAHAMKKLKEAAE